MTRAEALPPEDGISPVPVEVDSRRTLSVPQSSSDSPRFADGAETDWPSAIRFVIASRRSRSLSGSRLAAACSDETVISPPKIEMSDCSLRA